MNSFPEWVKVLAKEALDARNFAYAPYSGYTVGAALITENGNIYSGCNVENASYGATICAERNAFFKAISEGESVFRAIAIAGGTDGQEPVEHAYPCGICRQVMQEFCDEDFMIYTVKNFEEIEEFSLADLLPHGFGGANLKF